MRIFKLIFLFTLLLATAISSANLHRLKEPLWKKPNEEYRHLTREIEMIIRQFTGNLNYQILHSRYSNKNKPNKKKSKILIPKDHRHSKPKMIELRF